MKLGRKLLFIFLLAISGCFFRVGTVAAEQIDNYQISINIQSDSSLLVTEKIFYDFGAEERHGIFRDIPYKYQRDSFSYKLRLSDFSVKDETGQDYIFTKSVSGGDVQLKIGSADTLVTGRKVYIINYKVARALNYFSGSDELYWNAIGSGWGVDINQAIVSVTLPQPLAKENLKPDCYIGAYGEREACDIIAGDLTTEFSAPRVLSPAEGQTIVLNFPKGIVAPLSARTILVYFLSDNWPLLLPIFLLIFLYFFWRKYGRDPKGRGTIVVQYDAPEKMTPLEVGTLIDARADNKDLSAELVYLATKGYLKIEQIKAKGVLAPADYSLRVLVEVDSATPDFDKKLLSVILGKKKEIKTSELAGTITPMQIKEIKDLVYEAMKSRQLFMPKSFSLRSSFIVIGILLLVVGFFAITSAGNGGSSIALALSLMACGAIFWLFSGLMPQPTEKGAILREYIEGLKLYLSVAEAERIKFHNAPAKNPAVFEKLLPYAMVLGVEKEWAGQFADIYKNPPSWYTPFPGQAFVPLAFASDLGGFSKQINGVMASRGQSGSSGGFSGGGFSGGGFGGGGGGSW